MRLDFFSLAPYSLLIVYIVKLVWTVVRGMWLRLFWHCSVVNGDEMPATGNGGRPTGETLTFHVPKLVLPRRQ